MKKLFTQLIRPALAIAAAVAVSVLPARADGDSVIILAKDGTSCTAKIADVKSIELGSDGLVLNTKNESPATYLYADIDRILIGAQAGGIEGITADGSIAIWPTAVTSTLNVAGAKAGTPVRIYGVNGSLVASATASDGTLSIDLSSAPAGVCIVNVGTKTVKIIKK